MMDVYDEIQRRQHVAVAIIPFLLVDPSMIPLRNMARQKLSTLPESRFYDLTTEIFNEMKQRYPDKDRGRGVVSFSLEERRVEYVGWTALRWRPH